MCVDMLFVNLNKNVYIETVSHYLFHTRGMVTSSLCTFLSPLINALLESTYSMYFVLHVVIEDLLQRISLRHT